MTQMVFVLSTGRTGTKFIAEYFSRNYPDVLALHEPKPSYRLRVLSNAHVDGKVSAGTLLAALRRDRKQITDKLTQRLYVEATGYMYGCVDVLDQFTAAPIILHILRDPRDFVRSAHNYGSYSGRKRLATLFFPYWFPPVKQVLGRMAGHSWLQISAAKWAVINRVLFERGPRYPGYHLVRFEDIFDAQNSGLQQICGWLGLPFIADGRFSPKEKVNQSYQERLPRWPQWTPTQARELHALCSPLMQAHGYGQEPEWLSKIQ
jgi:hypothetical protein